MRSRVWLACRRRLRRRRSRHSRPRGGEPRFVRKNFFSERTWVRAVGLGQDLWWPAPFLTSSRIANTILTACSRSSSVCFCCAVRPASSWREKAVAAPGFWHPHGDRSPCGPCPPATGRAQGRPNSRLRGVSFAAITGVRDHLRRSSWLSTACRVRRLRGQRRPGDDHPSRRTARSGRPLAGVGADHGMRAQADRSAPGSRSIRSITGWECRAEITCGIAGGAAFPALPHPVRGQRHFRPGQNGSGMRRRGRSGCR